MIQKNISIVSSLEARPAALFVQTASHFKSQIKVQMDNKMVNAKSIMGMISLGILNGQQITLIVDGEDEQEAVTALEDFLAGE